MINFIVIIFSVLMIININQEFNESELNSFIKKYKEIQVSKTNDESISSFFSKKLDEYLIDENINYKDYDN